MIDEAKDKAIVRIKDHRRDPDSPFPAALTLRLMAPMHLSVGYLDLVLRDLPLTYFARPLVVGSYAVIQKSLRDLIIACHESAIVSPLVYCSAKSPEEAGGLSHPAWQVFDRSRPGRESVGF